MYILSRKNTLQGRKEVDSVAEVVKGEKHEEWKAVTRFLIIVAAGNLKCIC